MSKIAIIDLGSNSVRLVILHVEDNEGYRTILEVKEMVRLSEGMGGENLLRPDAIKRTVEVLKNFIRLCRSGSVDTIVAVATAAVRRAANQQDFLALVKSHTGIDFHVITDYEEAYLGYKGVICTTSITDGIVVDLGGASTEITLFMNRSLHETISLPYGAVNLTEHYLEKGRADEKKLQQLERFLSDQLKQVKWIKDTKLPLIGIGGTVRSLSKIHRIKTGHSLNITHNYCMRPEDIEAIYDSVKIKSIEERSRIPGISRNRADIIVAGISMIHTIVKAAEACQFIASGSGIREGLFYSRCLKQRGIEGFEDVCQESINNLFRLNKMDRAHADRVSELARSFFAQLAAMNEIPSEYEEVFRYASMLGDIGRSIDFYNRDNHTYYLLTNYRINGLSHREIALLALIASKFSGDKLKYYYMKHNDLIDKEDYKALKKLVAVLLICEGLDFSRTGMIESLKLKRSGGESNRLEVHVKKAGHAAMEIAEANKHQMLFKKAFGMNFILV